MTKVDSVPRLLGFVCCVLSASVLVGCTYSTESCQPQPFADLSQAAAYVGDDSLPFQFPLEDVNTESSPLHTNFCEGSSGPESSRKYHAAEDYFGPAGTPVYAMADGVISFSGRKGGYGWLVIIDHPQGNLYSLYGHLSPSRWRVESGAVEKGELIGYLGDSDENGGSAKNPLITHLHLGVRAGQRADYPSIGEWRWQAGWIKPCPADIGWLRPSEIISTQEIPSGGFSKTTGGLLSVWAPALLFVAIYFIGGASMLVVAIKKEKPRVLVVSCGFLGLAAYVFSANDQRVAYAILAMVAVFASIGTYHFVFRANGLTRASTLTK